MVIRDRSRSGELQDAKATIRLVSQGLLAGRGSMGPFQPLSLIGPKDYESRFGASCAHSELQLLFGRNSQRNDACALALNQVKKSALGSLSCRLPLLFAFVTPADCPSCMQEAIEWNQLSSGSRGTRLGLILIAAGVRTEEQHQFFDAMKVDAPIVFDNEGSTAKMCAVRETPMTLLFSESGELLLAKRSGISKREQEDFRTSVVRALHSEPEIP